MKINKEMTFLNDVTEDKIREVLVNLSGIGLQGLGKLVGIVLLIGFINLIFVAFAATNALWGDELTKLEWSAVGIILLIGIGFTVFSAYKMYEYTIKNSAAKVYDMIKEVVVKSICSEIVNAILVRKQQSQDLLSKEKFNKSFDIITMVGDKLNMLPTIVMKPLFKALSAIPFYGFIAEYWAIFDNKDSEEITELLYSKVNEFVKEEILATSLSWLLWLIPVNIITQLVIVFVS
jgi:hypothetical protein